MTRLNCYNCADAKDTVNYFELFPASIFANNIGSLVNNL